jgi:hypothetical protein
MGLIRMVATTEMAGEAQLCRMPYSNGGVFTALVPSGVNPTRTPNTVLPSPYHPLRL